MIEDIFEQEALVIGYVMNNPEAIDEIELIAENFTRTEHKIYYQCIIECATNSAKSLNVFSVREQFLQETGSQGDSLLDYSANAARNISSTVQFKSYAERIKKQSLITKADKIANELKEKLNIGDTDGIAKAVSDLMRIDKSEAKYEHSFSEVASMVVDAVDKSISGHLGAISTGYKELDDAMGGLNKTDLIIVPARPAMGKTAFMVNMLLKCGGRPGVISGEQGAEQMGIRSVCISGCVNHHDLRTGNIDEDEWGKISSGLALFNEKQGRLFDKPAPTMLDIEKIARKWVYKHNVDVLFIDYAQRIRHEDPRKEKTQAMSDIAMRLKELARELDIPIIALAQVNRACESRPDKRPQMGDIADASAFEKEADLIMTLYRDEVYNEDSSDKGIMEVDFKKNRHGPTGCVRLTWNAKYMRIDSFNASEYKQEPVAYQSEGFM